MYNTFLYLSIISLIITILMTLVLRKRNRGYKSYIRVFFVGIYICICLSLYPINRSLFEKDYLGSINTVLYNIYYTTKTFSMSAPYERVIQYISAAYGNRSQISIMNFYYQFLFFIAPFISIGIVLTFFDNVSWLIRILFSKRKDMYIFNSVTEESLVLAEDIFKNTKGLIVFEMETNDIKDNYKNFIYKLHGIITNNNKLLKRYSKNRNVTYFAMDKCDKTNIQYTMDLIKSVDKKNNCTVYLFSESKESELLFSNNHTGIRIHRINTIQSLIYRDLYDNGIRFFKTAKKVNNQRNIHIVLVGLGSIGLEYLKALTWACQMNGYKLFIDAFDNRKGVSARVKTVCPDLLDSKYNFNNIDGDAFYGIRIHEGIDVKTNRFYEILDGYSDISNYIVCVGNDASNIEISLEIRKYEERMNRSAQIRCLVFDDYKNNLLKNATNFKNQQYRISFFGDRRSIYSYRSIIHSDLESLALSRHMSYGGSKEDFWNYPYNYRSSTASIIHRHLRILCKIPGSEKAIEDRTEDEKQALRVLEHKRWNAYMRSEGYSFSEIRNDLAKLHWFLVPFDQLPDVEKDKDDL